MEEAVTGEMEPKILQLVGTCGNGCQCAQGSTVEIPRLARSIDARCHGRLIGYCADD